MTPEAIEGTMMGGEKVEKGRQEMPL